MKGDEVYGACSIHNSNYKYNVLSKHNIIFCTCNCTANHLKIQNCSCKTKR